MKKALLVVAFACSASPAPRGGQSPGTETRLATAAEIHQMAESVQSLPRQQVTSPEDAPGAPWLTAPQRAEITLWRDGAQVRAIAATLEYHTIGSETAQGVLPPDTSRTLEITFDHDGRARLLGIRQTVIEYSAECVELFDRMDEIDLRDPASLDACMQSGQPREAELRCVVLDGPRLIVSTTAEGSDASIDHALAALELEPPDRAWVEQVASEWRHWAEAVRR